MHWVAEGAVIYLQRKEAETNKLQYKALLANVDPNLPKAEILKLVQHIGGAQVSYPDPVLRTATRGQGRGVETTP